MSDRNSNSTNWILSLSLIVTIALFAVASLWPFGQMWGINHGQFLPSPITWLLVGATGVLVALYIVKRSNIGGSALTDTIARLVWSDSLIPRWSLSLAFVLVAFLLRVETHFLGDGYGWLGNFSSDSYYISKWTEPIAMHTVRFFQWILGGFNQDTALLAFRIISFTSGFILVLNVIAILRRLCSNNSLRLLGLVTFLLSGAILQFFGYVEFYSPLWAAITAFFRVSLAYMDKEGKLWAVIVTFLLSAAFHLQALYLSGAVILLLYDRYYREFAINRAARRFYLLLGSLFALFALTLVWLSQTDIIIESIFLPLIEGRPQKPNYTVFSPSHLLDMLNLVLLIFPGALFLVALNLSGKRSKTISVRGHFLLLSSIGSFTFLLVIDPVIGLARDWDLMSVTLLAPALGLFHLLDVRRVRVAGRAILAYSLVCLLLTGTFLTASISVESSISRYHTLLKNYGSQNRNGWVILARYLTSANRTGLLNEVENEMAQLFPQDALINKALLQIRSGQVAEALGIARSLHDADPYNHLYLQLLGNCFGKLGNLDSAVHFYARALKLNQLNANIMSELGVIYLQTGNTIKALELLRSAQEMDPLNDDYNEGVAMAFYRLGEYDSTSVIATGMLERDSLSSAGHLLKLMLATDRRDTTSARHYYKLFKQTGFDRPSYDAILKYYKPPDQ